MLFFAKPRNTLNYFANERVAIRMNVLYEPVGQGFESLAARQVHSVHHAKPSPSTG